MTKQLERITVAFKPAPAVMQTKRSTNLSKQAKTIMDRVTEKENECKRDVTVSELAASMPTDRAGLLAVAKEAVQLYNNAVLSRANFAALVISDRYNAVIWKLNGNSFSGSNAGDESAAEIVARHCQGVPGEVPEWGQQGEFIICVNDIRCWVKYGGGLGSVMGCHLEFNIVDVDGPFISETGYRSNFCGAIWGKTVDTIATEIFSDFMRTGRRYLLADSQDHCAARPLPNWMKLLEIPARRTRAIREVQNTISVVPDGFAFVDVVISARQAFIVRKWAKYASPRIKAALKNC